jgi:formate-dependent nitrite reductase membrane component NrfD
MRADSPLWLWVAPVVSGAFLGLTGLLLVWDLEHPARFYLIFTRPQWRSWLVKGAFIIAGYSLVLAVHFLISIFGYRMVPAAPNEDMARWAMTAQTWLMLPGIILSALTAVYTAYLFAQAKARDLWQNPLLPPHLLVQALVLGSAVLVPFALAAPFNSGPDEFFSPAFVATLWVLGIGSLLHLLMILGEVSITHATAHARLATWEMTRARYKNFFWIGVLLSLAGAVLPFATLFGQLSLGVAGAPLALFGLMLYEHAYVQAGQSVPLA